GWVWARRGNRGREIRSREAHARSAAAGSFGSRTFGARRKRTGMKRAFHIAVMGALLALASGCDSLPGKPGPGPEVPRPDSILDPATLYKENCAGCHGQNGRGGIATPIGLPEYQALVDEATQLNIVTNGVPHSAMPGFSRKAGGFLTDQQIAA